MTEYTLNTFYDITKILQKSPCAYTGTVGQHVHALTVVLLPHLHAHVLCIDTFIIHTTISVDRKAKSESCKVPHGFIGHTCLLNRDGIY